MCVCLFLLVSSSVCLFLSVCTCLSVLFLSMCRVLVLSILFLSICPVLVYLSCSCLSVLFLSICPVLVYLSCSCLSVRSCLSFLNSSYACLSYHLDSNKHSLLRDGINSDCKKIIAPAHPLAICCKVKAYMFCLFSSFCLLPIPNAVVLRMFAKLLRLFVVLRPGCVFT